jgi:hypothetical protein
MHTEACQQVVCDKNKQAKRNMLTEEKVSDI